MFVCNSVITQVLEQSHIDDSSRMLVERLLKRKNNHIILLPYNPRRHWVLVVLDMEKAICYYLDSLRPSNVNPQLKQIIKAAMALYVPQNNKSVKLNWVNARCPC